MAKRLLLKVRNVSHSLSADWQIWSISPPSPACLPGEINSIANTTFLTKSL